MSVCPSGWHLPSDTEWSILINYADGTGGSERRDSPTAGIHLKATSGWYSNGNGQDTYGFAALPGGYGGSDGSFYGAGNYGYWWSASESAASYAYHRYMVNYNQYAYWYFIDKSNLRSVRCVKD